MARSTVNDEDPFDVARVEAIGGPAGARAAFGQLEVRIHTLRGAKMYGALYPDKPPRYFACLRLDGHEPDDLGFDRAVIPGGSYTRRLIRDWVSRVDELPDLFDQVHADLIEAGYRHDRSRPSLEYYRRIDELVIMVPVAKAH